MGSNSAADRFGRMALSMEIVALSFDSIADQSATAVERRNAEHVAEILRVLGAAMDAAQLGCPGALEALALEAAEIQTCKKFCDAMEARLAEAVPVLAFCGDSQEGD